MFDIYELEEAEKLFAQGEYAQCMNKCTELLRNGIERSCRFLSISGRAFLFCSDIPLDDSQKNRLNRIVGDAYRAAKTPEEVLKVEYEMVDAVAKYTTYSVEIVTGKLQQNPSWDVLNIYHEGLVYPSYGLLMTDLTRLGLVLRGEADGVIKYTKEDEAAAKEKFGPKATLPTQDDFALIVLDGAYKILSASLSVLNDNNAGSAEFMKAVAVSTYDKLRVASGMVALVCPKRYMDTSMTPQVNYKCQTLKMQLAKTILEAAVFPEGKAYSILQNQESRQHFLNEFKEANDMARELNPEHVPCEAPSVAPVDDYSSKGGCYVATAVYGSYDCPQVWTLRRFRDNTLASTWHGRVFIRTYYAVSPILVKWFGQTEWFKNFWRDKLDKMVDTLQKRGVESTPYQDKKW